MKTPGIGIKGLGIYLPEERRSNSFWSPDVVAGFSRRPDEDLGEVLAPDSADPEIAGIVKEEMSKWKADPFHGAVERRVAPPKAFSSDLEYEAAKAAIDDAGISPQDIDLILVLSIVADQPLSPNPVRLHHRLGLPLTCPAMATDQTCSGFLFQMQLASAYLQASGGRNALLVQSGLFSRIADYSAPLSTTLGDAASAVVLGRMSRPDQGILGIQSFTNSEFNQVAVIDAPANGKRWYEGGGPVQLGTRDPARIKNLPYIAAAGARSSVESVLREADIQKSAVSFFTSHQPTSSFVAICKRAAGLGSAKSLDSFRFLGAIGSCVVPINLYLARKERMLNPDDVAVIFSTGSGLSWSAAALRWGG